VVAADFGRAAARVFQSKIDYPSVLTARGGMKSAAVTAASAWVCVVYSYVYVRVCVCTSAKHKTRVEYEANIHQLASVGNACNSAALTFHRGRPRFNKLTRLWIL
jgi:hypothetical protein